MNLELRRAVLHDRALADAELAIARAVDSAPTSDAKQALLAAWRPIRTHAGYARRDLRVQANQAAGAA